MKPSNLRTSPRRRIKPHIFKQDGRWKVQCADSLMTKTHEESRKLMTLNLRAISAVGKLNRGVRLSTDRGRAAMNPCCEVSQP